MIYKFKIPIGDWSGDGHGHCKWYVIASSQPLDYVRELYFQACSKLGFSLDGNSKLTPCCKYQDSYISKETYEKLVDFGVNIFEHCDSEDVIREFEKEGAIYIISEEFLQIIIKLIKTQDPELILAEIEDDIPTFTFYGRDSKNRHIGFFGYGLF